MTHYKDMCVDESSKLEGTYMWCPSHISGCNMCKKEHVWVNELTTTAATANGATGWFEEADRCVWCANNEEPVRGMCYDDLMDGAFACPTPDAADAAAAASTLASYNIENCAMCRNQEHWRPEIMYCVECNAGYFMNSNQECVDLFSTDSDATAITNHCATTAGSPGPFMVEGSTT
jgi:hypothetical protein